MGRMFSYLHAVGIIFEGILSTFSWAFMSRGLRMGAGVGLNASVIIEVALVGLKENSSFVAADMTLCRFKKWPNSVSSGAVIADPASSPVLGDRLRSSSLSSPSRSVHCSSMLFVVGRLPSVVPVTAAVPMTGAVPLSFEGAVSEICRRLLGTKIGSPLLSSISPITSSGKLFELATVLGLTWLKAGVSVGRGSESPAFASKFASDYFYLGCSVEIWPLFWSLVSPLALAFAG